MITIFNPASLWDNGGKIVRGPDGKIVNWKPAPVGVFLKEDWHGVVRWVSEPMKASEKEEHGAFVCARMRGPRKIENVEMVTALGLDGDKTNVTAKEIHERLRGYRHVVYTTFSSTPEHPRWRAIIALSRVATADEHRKYIVLAHKNLAAAGVNVDPAAKDPCRLWYVPCAKDHFECYEADGRPFDVDAALRTANEMEAELKRFFEARARRSGSGSGDRASRARAYVSRMPAAVSGSGGHMATWNVARKLLADFELSESEAWPIFVEYNARCLPPWSEAELRHKMRGAARAHTSHPMGDSRER